MELYGNNTYLLDATYITTKYSFHMPNDGDANYQSELDR